MADLGKQSRVELILEDFKRLGWSKPGPAIASLSLEPEHLSHFRSALSAVQLMLEWQLAREDEGGAYPNHEALIVQTIARLNAELGRLENSVDAPLFYIEESRRRNRKGADPSVYRRIVVIGVFYRLYRDRFVSDYAFNRYVSRMLCAAGAQCSASSIADQISRFRAEFTWPEGEDDAPPQQLSHRNKATQAATFYGERREAALLLLSEPVRRQRLEAEMIEAALTAKSFLKQRDRAPRSRQHRSKRGPQQNRHAR